MSFVKKIVGKITGSEDASKAAGKAAKTQEKSAQEANALQRYFYDTNRADQKVFMDNGRAASNELAMLLGLGSQPGQTGLSGFLGRGIARTGVIRNPSAQHGFGSLMDDFGMDDFEADPGYQFRLSEGMKGINNSAAARGGVLSGAALKAAGRYNQDFASNEFTNSYNRWNTNNTNKFNRLASLAGAGQTSTAQVGNQGAQAGQVMGNNLIGAGNARASAYITQGNQWGRDFNTLVKIAGAAAGGMSGNPAAAGNKFGWAGMGGFGDSYGTSYGE